jgi:hypothetical protein
MVLNIFGVLRHVEDGPSAEPKEFHEGLQPFEDLVAEDIGDGGVLGNVAAG